MGQFFEDFAQVTDEDVAALLQKNDSPVQLRISSLLTPVSMADL